MNLGRRYLNAPILVILFVAFVVKAKRTTEIPLGAIVMQLRSTVDANSTELNGRVGNATTEYLNEYFQAYYTRTEQVVPDYFSEVNLATKSFGVHGLDRSFISTIEMEGTLLFNTDNPPNNLFIDTLLRNAFQGRNEKLYVDKLLAIEDNAFLQNLTYLIIDINQGKVAESPIRDNDDDARASKNKDAKNGTYLNVTSSNKEEETGFVKKNTLGEKRFRAAMYVLSTLLTFVILSCTWYTYQKYHKERANKNKKGDSYKEPMKVIKLPVKKQSSSPRPNNKKKKKSENMKTNMISPTSTAITLRSPGTPPSPQLSMTSQASSMFTYNDNMSKFMTRNTNNHTFSPTACNHSKFTIDDPSIDLGVWRGGGQDPPAFGSDISVIEKQKDLSLIREKQDDIEAGLRSNNKNLYRNNSDRNRHSSRRSRVALDARQSTKRPSNRSETYFYNGRHVSHDDSDIDSDSDSADGRDVIGDLHDLSMQIKRERSSRGSKRVIDQ